MNLVPLIVMIVGFLACGMAFIKWQRRKELKDRTKKLKIAQGDFSEEELPKPKRKKRSRRTSWLTDGIDSGLPSHVESELLTVVPGMVDKLLSTRVTASEHRSSLQKLELDYVAAVRKVNFIVLPQRLDRADMGNWWNELLQVVRNQEQLAASYWQMRSSFLESARVHIEIVERLQTFIKQMEPHDLDDLCQEAQTNFALLREILAGKDIGRAAFETIPEKVKVPVPPIRPAGESAVLIEEFLQLETAVKTMCQQLVRLTAGANSLQSAFARSHVVWQEPELEPPQRPADSDINALLGAAERWALQAMKHDKELKQVIAEVDFSRLRLMPELASLTLGNLLVTIRHLDEQRTKEKSEAEAQAAKAANEFRPTGGFRRSWSVESDAKSNAEPVKPQVPRPTLPPSRRRWGLFGGGDGNASPLSKTYVASLVTPPDKFGVDAPKIVPQAPSSELTAEQAVLQIAATRVHALTESVVKSIVGAVATEKSRQDGIRPVLPIAAEGSVGTATTSGAVANANRKFCFAVAQLSVAELKLQRALDDAEAEVEDEESILAEKDGAAYVRRFQQWQAAIAVADKANEKRAEKVATLETQRDDRRKQASDVRAALGKMHVDAEMVEIPEELEKQLLVAGILLRRLDVD